MASSSDSNGLAFGLIMFSIVILTLLSFALPVFVPSHITNDNPTLEDLENQYYSFTDSLPTSEAVWGLTGIYTAYGYNADGTPSTIWGYTADGWLYGQRVVNYTPSQYYNDGTSYSAQYNAETGLYYYTDTSTTVNQHTAGDLYGSVVMDVGKKSDIFFTSNGKVTDGDFYYYKFNGLRYSWQPVAEYKALDNNGNLRDVVPNTTSLSLIWYDYYGSSGIAGQLIITGADSGVAYLTASQIVSAFNSDTSTSRFTLAFNGIDCYIHIRIDPRALSSGLTIEDCYNQGYWSVMVSSPSADVSSMAGADYEFNPTDVFHTMIDLLTFKTSDYGLTGIAGVLSSFIIVIPLMAGLITIGLDKYQILIMAGIYGVISAINWGGLIG